MKTLKICLVGAIVLCGMGSQAQVYNTVNSPSRNAINKKESRAELIGDPYLYPAFQKAEVKFVNGNKGLYEIKYDQLDDAITVKAKEEGGEEYSFSDPVNEFHFVESKRTFRNGFAAGTKTTDKSFYEVLYDGKTKYVKRVVKVIIESKEYNAAATTKKIEKDDSYFLVKSNGALEPVKNSEKSILTALGKPELASYVKQEKLNLKNDADVAKLLAHYDTL